MVEPPSPSFPFPVTHGCLRNCCSMTFISALLLLSLSRDHYYKWATLFIYFPSKQTRTGSSPFSFHLITVFSFAPKLLVQCTSVLPAACASHTLFDSSSLTRAGLFFFCAHKLSVAPWNLKLELNKCPAYYKWLCVRAPCSMSGRGEICHMMGAVVTPA